MVTEDDDIDPESLQAQVDMTMSFAHNLVSSWIKPTYFAQLGSSDVNATSILEEELRLPPRLGVGASVPSTAPLAHEAAKLQRRLGKNAVNNHVAESRSQDSPRSDNEEYKGRPAKRKTKLDPFQPEGSKKKRKPSSEADPHLPVENGLKHAVSIPGSTLGPIINSCSTKEQQIGPGDQRSVTLLTQATPSTIVPSRSEPSRKTSEAPGPGIITAESIGLHLNSVPIPDKASISLLNLDGPPEFADKPGNGSELSNGLKKKRRRRKKKAKMSGTGDSLR